MGKFVVLVAVTLFGAGCIDDSLVTCGDLKCPAASVCVAGGCATEEEVTACEGIEEGNACATLTTPRGTCRGAACRAIVCGNGFRELGEQCDDGNETSGDGCSANCASTETCGNGVLDPGEACDDGNLTDADGCQHDCRIPRCGDGIVDVGFGEVCDDGNVVDSDGCAGNCRSSELCGNGVIDRQVGEACDDGNTTDADGCQHTCQIPRCGDSILDPGELCDAGNANSLAPDAVCRPSCRPPSCGDGTRDTGEACDDGNLTAGDGCSADCRSNETCGNGIVDGIAGEECDSGLPGLSADGCSSQCTAEAETWADVTPQPPAARGGHSMAFDSTRGVTVMLGGTGDGVTWEFDGTNWIPRVTAHAPPTPLEAAMAYDPVRKRVVLFGGLVNSTGSDATWEYDGVDWVQRQTAVSPPPCSYTDMTYDASIDRMVLFGCSYPPATWEYADGVWTQISTPASPPSLVAPASAYDAATGEVVLFGGYDTNTTTRTNRLWAFDGVTWTERVTTNPPPGRFHAGLTYDVNRQRLVLFGGDAGAQALGDTWELDGTVWQQRVIAGPSARRGPRLVYDSLRQSVVLFSGGSEADTWTYDGASWQSVAFQPGFGSAAYDSVRGVTVLFANDWTTWELDRGRWLHKRPTVVPSDRESAVITYDPDRRVVVLFGGSTPNDATSLDDTWEYDGTTWRQVLTPTSPAARYAQAMAYDPVRKRIILVGGTTSDLTTWAYDGITWTPLATPNDSPGRAGATLCYDELNQRLVMTAGSPYASPSSGDAWVLDASGWSEIPVSDPAPSGVGACVYDPQRRRIYIQDGAGQSWELDGLQWRRRPTAQRGPGGFQMVYDAAHLRALVIGGPGVIAHTYSSAANPPDACIVGVDSDGDGLIACGDGTTAADPDCWGICTPLCPPLTTCDPSAPRCGDAVCDTPREDATHCPADCP